MALHTVSLRMDDFPPTMTLVQELSGCRIYRHDETGVHYIIAASPQGRPSCTIMLNADGSPFVYMPPGERSKYSVKILEDFDSMTRLQRKQRRRWIAFFVAAQCVAAALAAIISVNIFS